ncbi:MAG: plasmid pRiA4b ORF-3 family protein [Dermabacteraceae bacterium]|nr:plasmid pRiA4b ORF-3 family protein [Brachybacterium sp.]MDN6400112.1 plasmid pRiA4b ORF-3 family protein [Brachybacterium sp.]
MATSPHTDGSFEDRFREIIGALETDQPHALLGDLRGPRAAATRRAERRERRRPLPATRQMITVSVDLHGATPPIWRRLELRSDLSLTDVHDVLQTAFDWAGYHLWRFAAGGDPFDLGAQLFLCEFDVEEGDEDGLPAEAVQLGELLQEPGDRLEYVYDYGDNWDLRIVVDSVREATPEAAPARATGGRRAAPPEDCGGLRDAEDLAAVLEDPARFDVEELDRELWAGPSPLAARSAEEDALPMLVEPLRVLGRSAAGRDLHRRAARLAASPESLADTAGDNGLAAVTWFLEQADAGDGIPLTGAGYLRPATVQAASDVVPSMVHWIGLRNREVQSAPLLHFRQALQQSAILRKYKGTLRPTRRARAAFRAGSVRELVAESLIPQRGGFDHVGSLLLMVHVATTEPGEAIAVGEICRAATELGWHIDGGPVPPAAVLELPSWHLLANIGHRSGPRKALGESFSPEAAALAQEALHR